VAAAAGTAAAEAPKPPPLHLRPFIELAYGKRGARRGACSLPVWLRGQPRVAFLCLLFLVISSRQPNIATVTSLQIELPRSTPPLPPTCCPPAAPLPQATCGRWCGRAPSPNTHPSTLLPCPPCAGYLPLVWAGTLASLACYSPLHPAALPPLRRLPAAGVGGHPRLPRLLLTPPPCCPAPLAQATCRWCGRAPSPPSPATHPSTLLPCPPCAGYLPLVWAGTLAYYLDNAFEEAGLILPVGG